MRKHLQKVSLAIIPEDERMNRGRGVDVSKLPSDSFDRNRDAQPPPSKFKGSSHVSRILPEVQDMDVRNGAICARAYPEARSEWPVN